MNTNRNVWTRLFVMFLSLAMGAAPCLAHAPQGKKAAAAAKKPNTGSGGGQQEGIKVHGHWTIEVRNPDGSVASRTEFENALAGGDSVLADLLTRRAVAGPWTIVLGDWQLISGPCNAGLGPTFCFITEAGAAPQPNRFPNLIMARLQGPARVQLSGTATAAHPFSLFDASTIQSSCQDPNTSPVACASAGIGSGGGVTFTNHRLQTPISVVAGQIIQVTVVISFS